MIDGVNLQERTRMKERKKLSYDEIQVGQKIFCYHLGRQCTISWRDIVKEITENGVILYSKRFSNDAGELIPKEAVFEVELTEEEFNQKYHEDAREVYNILNSGEYVGDHGYHEMDNSWQGSSCQEIYKRLAEQHLHLLGWFWLQEIRHGWFADYDVGMVVEDDTGERFWCHYKKQWIDDILEYYALEEVTKARGQQ